MTGIEDAEENKRGLLSYLYIYKLYIILKKPDG